MKDAYFKVVSSPLGPLWLCATECGVCGLGFGETPSSLIQHLARHGVVELQAGTHSILKKAEEQLERYFEGVLQEFDVSLDLRGTPFQVVVWQVLENIPYGQTWTYGEVAQIIKRPRAVRAVGRAVGQNPVSIIVPCHRVVGYNGALTGYGGGLPRKKSLLELEGWHRSPRQRGDSGG